MRESESEMRLGTINSRPSARQLRYARSADRESQMTGAKVPIDRDQFGNQFGTL